MSNKDYKQMSDSEKKKEDWMNSKWRPMMGWMYMAVCMADFVLFPVLWSLVQAAHGGSVQTQWSPITLARRRIIPHGHGCYFGYRSIWTHTRKNSRCQQWRNGCSTCGRFVLCTTSNQFRHTYTYCSTCEFQQRRNCSRQSSSS
jgi:hypothetical protein